MINSHHIVLTVNGVKRDGVVEGRRLLSDFIRDDLALTGTHIGCEHGVCGACTILINGEAARSCLMFAVQANNAEIETIEGLTHSGKIARLQDLGLDDSRGRDGDRLKAQLRRRIASRLFCARIDGELSSAPLQ